MAGALLVGKHSLDPDKPGGGEEGRTSRVVGKNH
jgi:hypothetical protein